jgi:hypothetical protein
MDERKTLEQKLKERQETIKYFKSFVESLIDNTAKKEIEKIHEAEEKKMILMLIQDDPRKTG